MRRIATALVGIPLVALGIRYAPDPLLAAVVAALAVLGLLELERMAAVGGVRLERWVALPLAAAMPFGWLWTAPTKMPLPIVALAVLAVLAHAVLARRPLEQALPAAGATLLGVLWVGLLLSYFVAIRLRSHGAEVLYTLLLVVWVGDSGAYYVGRALGRRKLAPVVSPGKTVAGLVGGLLTSALAALAARALFVLPHAPGPAWMAGLGLLVGAVGTMGDLAESALKRGAGVKDSGTIFPGHGGVLDRLDSLLFAAPVMYYCFTRRPTLAPGGRLPPLPGGSRPHLQLPR